MECINAYNYMYMNMERLCSREDGSKLHGVRRKPMQHYEVDENHRQGHEWKTSEGENRTIAIPYKPTEAANASNRKVYKTTHF